MEEIKNYYEVLELEKNCSYDDIRKKFKQLAIKYHPDKIESYLLNQIDKQNIDKNFKQIETAYRILIDLESRRKYDAELSYMQANLPIINEEIKITDFVKKVINNETNKHEINDQAIYVYEYKCRCGDSYKLSTDQYHETLNKFDKDLIASIIISCDTCSLYVKVFSL